MGEVHLARFYYRCKKPRSKIICRPQHAAAVPYGMSAGHGMP